MKINTGNFGNNGARFTPVHTDNPEALSGAQAEKQAAQSTMAAQDTLQQGYRQNTQVAGQQAQATAQVAQAVGGIGAELVQYSQSLARQKSEIQLQDYQTYKQGVLQGIQDKVANGELDSVGIQKAYDDGMKGWTSEEIPDLTGEDKMRLSKGMSTLDRQAGQQVTSLYGRQLHVERINAAEQTVAGYGQMILQPGADVAAIGGRIDEYFNRPDTRALFGASWASKYAGAKKSLQTNFFQAQIEQNQNDNGALQDLRGAVMQHTDDPAARTSLLNAIDTKQSRNDARAQAAQNHADSVALRRENAAIHADSQMSQRIAAGEIPADTDWQRFEQLTGGTSVAGKTSALKQSVVVTQQLLTMPPTAAQAALDTQRLALQQRGGTALDYDVLNNTQRALDRRAADLRTNPQSVGAMDRGEPLQPISPVAAMENPGQFGALLQDRLVNSKALAQKYGPTAGKSLLTKDELSDTKEMYSKLTPDQRVQFWRNTNASAGQEVTAQLARDIGGDSLTMSAVSAGAGSKDGYQTAITIERGNQLLNPVDGAAKVKAPKNEDLADRIKKEYPDLSPSQIQRLVPVMSAYHVGKGNDPESMPSTDDMHAAIGTPVKVMGVTLVAPVGADADNYRKNVQDQVNRLPAAQSANVRNHLENGSYTFIPDSAGNLRLINRDTNRTVTVGGTPFVVENNH